MSVKAVCLFGSFAGCLGDLEAVGLKEGRIGQDRLRVAVGGYASLIHDHRPRKQMANDRYVVSGDDHRLGQCL